jgi:hypothetical protein
MSRSPLLAGSVLTLLLASGCAVRLIGDYDEVIDHGITDFQEKADAYLIQLSEASGTAAAAYAPAFYDQSQARLGSLRTRAEASFKKEILAKQITLLIDTMDKLRALHKDMGQKITPGAIDASRAAIESQVGSILKLELALKRGKKTGRLRPLPRSGLAVAAN